MDAVGDVYSTLGKLIISGNVVVAGVLFFDVCYRFDMIITASEFKVVQSKGLLYMVTPVMKKIL